MHQMHTQICEFREFAFLIYQVEYPYHACTHATHVKVGADETVSVSKQAHEELPLLHSRVP